jgi:hypothetical protein
VKGQLEKSKAWNEQLAIKNEETVKNLLQVATNNDQLQ